MNAPLHSPSFVQSKLTCKLCELRSYMLLYPSPSSCNPLTVRNSLNAFFRTHDFKMTAINSSPEHFIPRYLPTTHPRTPQYQSSQHNETSSHVKFGTNKKPNIRLNVNYTLCVLSLLNFRSFIQCTHLNDLRLH